jgi:hypothetical protein
MQDTDYTDFGPKSVINFNDFTKLPIAGSRHLENLDTQSTFFYTSLLTWKNGNNYNVFFINIFLLASSNEAKQDFSTQFTYFCNKLKNVKISKVWNELISKTSERSFVRLSVDTIPVVNYRKRDSEKLYLLLADNVSNPNKFKDLRNHMVFAYAEDQISAKRHYKLPVGDDYLFAFDVELLENPTILERLKSANAM